MDDDNKIIYISGSGYNPSAMAPIFDNVSAWCQQVIEKFPIASKEGSDISIRFGINYERRDEYKDINAYAGRDTCGNADYRICFYAALIYNQWLTSRLPTSYAKPFKRVLDGLNVPASTAKTERLADVMLFMSTVFVLSHEFAHIVLGHVDWRSDKFGGSKYLEVDSDASVKPFVGETFAMEAEADALAASFLLTICSFFCLSDNTFKSIEDGLWTLAFSVTMTMHIFENKILLNGPPKHRTHPSPPERWFMFFAHLLPNAKKLYGERPGAELAILDGAATAFKMSGLGNLYSGFDPISHAALMVQIGHDLDRLELDGRRLFLKTPMGFSKVRVA